MASVLNPQGPASHGSTLSCTPLLCLPNSLRVMLPVSFSPRVLVIECDLEINEERQKVGAAVGLPEGYVPVSLPRRDFGLGDAWSA